MGKKWLAGIGAAVVGGLLVWFLTTGPLAPVLRSIGPAPSPDVKIITHETETRINRSKTHELASIRFELYNAGPVSAVRCVATWSYDGNHPDETSTRFDLPSKATRSVTLVQRLPYLHPFHHASTGRGRYSLCVSCANSADQYVGDPRYAILCAGRSVIPRIPLGQGAPRREETVGPVVALREPPAPVRHVRWCGSWGLVTAPGYPQGVPSTRTKTPLW